MGSSVPPIRWPGDCAFAFSVFDDTDRATLDNVQHVYALMRDLGLRTTKSVWPLEGTRAPDVVGGTTCGDSAYAAWVQELQAEGFEIGLHNVTYHSSTRPEVQQGLARFTELFSERPRAFANHTTCRDGMYWGDARVTGLQRSAYNLATRFRRRGWFQGHVPTSPYFWGDLCLEHVDYVRNFTFARVDTLAACPWMPYFDADRPWVKAWYASSDGAQCETYVKMLDERAQDELERSGGACIVYTHFGKGFYEHGALDRRFAELMKRLSHKRGWFVPVSTLLDHIAQARGGIHRITAAERGRMERRWLFDKVVSGCG